MCICCLIRRNCAGVPASRPGSAEFRKLHREHFWRWVRHRMAEAAGKGAFFRRGGEVPTLVSRATGTDVCGLASSRIVRCRAVRRSSDGQMI